jgi:hypothetical protein
MLVGFVASAFMPNVSGFVASEFMPNVSGVHLCCVIFSVLSTIVFLLTTVL